VITFWVEESCIRVTSPGAIGVGDQSLRITNNLDCFEQTDPILGTDVTTYNCILCTDTIDEPLSVWRRSSAFGFAHQFLRVLHHGRVTNSACDYANAIMKITAAGNRMTAAALYDARSDKTGIDAVGAATAIMAVRSGVFAAARSVLSEGATDRSTLETMRLDLITPKSAEEDIRTLTRFQTILDGWKGKLFTNTLERLRAQLSYLLADEEELNELLQAPGTKSFEALLGYLAARPWIKAPSLTLTRNGVFVANWRPAREAKARLSVDFINEKRARWSGVDAQDADAPTMAGGVCSVSDLDEHLRPYRGWICL
jgi:hypothetical protein